MTDQSIVDQTAAANNASERVPAPETAVSTVKTPLMEWFAELLRGPMVRDEGYFERLAAATAASAPTSANATCRSCAG